MGDQPPELQDSDAVEPSRPNAFQRGLASVGAAIGAGWEFSADALGLVGNAAGKLHGPLNGLIGDRLEAAGSSLALPMTLFTFQGNAFVSVEPKRSILESLGLPRSDHVCIFVHGLGSNQHTWLLRGRKGEPSCVGHRLERERGVASFYVRYNTGRHISENGRSLARLVEELFRNYPRPIREISLIGHSMGGLVVRSAGHYAFEENLAWKKLLRRTFLLGSPLMGAHQEQIGKLTADVLAVIPNFATRMVARVAEARSAGIQDLRYGYLIDEDWRNAPKSELTGLTTGTNRRRPLPLLRGVSYYLIVGSIHADPESIAAAFLGDGVVARHSARARGGASDRYEDYEGAIVREIPGLGHLEIPGDARVYRQLRAWLPSGPQDS